LKTTNFKITIQGLSAHGSAPHSGHDALVAASSTIMNLQAIASRINNPLNPFSLTVSTFDGGTRFNIIPDHAELKGSFVTESAEFAAKASKLIEKIVKDSVDVYGCSATIE
jgi:metal-dependent amidase/aminoacylase/carboxypeptidase family protein